MTPYEKLTPALREWVDQAVACVPAEDQYRRRRELAERVQALYEGFCTEGQAGDAEARTLDRLGLANVAAAECRAENKREKMRMARIMLAASIVLLFICAVALYIEFTRRPMPAWSAAKVGGLLSFTGIILVGSIAYYRSVKKEEDNL